MSPDNVERYWKFLRISVVTIFCFAVWFLFSGEYSEYSIYAGFIFAFISAIYSYNIYIEDSEIHRSAIFFRFDLLFIYLLLIFIEGYFASYELIKLVFKRKYNPGIIRIKTKLRSDIGRVLLANSITMVPGTLSVWMENNYIFVHWFDVKTINSIHSGKIIKERLEKMIGRIFQ
ncbi:MAG: Na+/H+ antiporter subunit E [Candidatus Muiribacteriota bacterium]